MTARGQHGGDKQSFTAAELAYFSDVHPIAHLATVGADGVPHVTPLGTYWVDIGSGVVVTSGLELQRTKKWRDVERTGRAAFVVDDMLPPFRPRGIEVRGRATVAHGAHPTIVIRPERVIAWGIDED